MTAPICTAKVVGTDQKTDLALIKVDRKTTFSCEFRRPPLAHRDWVVAVATSALAAL